eukprot:scaffold17515_cov116-Isochrysis_galbana.AAC.3
MSERAPGGGWIGMPERRGVELLAGTGDAGIGLRRLFGRRATGGLADERASPWWRERDSDGDGAPADARARGLAPPHAGPLGRHTFILTTPSSPQHTDCFRCLAVPPRERAKPGGLSCQRNAQLQPASACLPACTPRQPDGCIASKDVTE